MHFIVSITNRNTWKTRILFKNGSRVWIRRCIINTISDVFQIHIPRDKKKPFKVWKRVNFLVFE